jgi:hypothetical protein
MTHPPLNSCVSPEGKFIWGLHRPQLGAHNFRNTDVIQPLGRLADGTVIDNRVNFPEGHLPPRNADPVYEIPNPFPFRGSTFIIKPEADRQAAQISGIALPPAPQFSFSDWMTDALQRPPRPEERARFLATLPAPLQLTLASCCDDPADLRGLAHLACEIDMQPGSRQPWGMVMQPGPEGVPRPLIHHPELFKVLVNNPWLPDGYKAVMVLRPGIQGSSPVVGESGRAGGESHVSEYLRHNSYIPWGHYAANMAADAVRYRIDALRLADLEAMRRLYYQRTYARLGAELGLEIPARRRPLTSGELENLRLESREAVEKMDDPQTLPFTGTLWGWNLGFDFSPSGYRLHASHQQIHQQFALVPATVPRAAPPRNRPWQEDTIPAFHCGRLIQSFIADYRRLGGRPFFDAYLEAIAANRRTDGNPAGPCSLVVWATSQVMLLVPKAQTSQWELQILTLPPVGNILEAPPGLRRDLDRALWIAVRVLAALGAKMITSIEYSKPFWGGETDQRLVYALMPKMPYSPGSFTEAQLRWINGHYPEDFAEACRRQLTPEMTAQSE